MPPPIRPETPEQKADRLKLEGDRLKRWRGKHGLTQEQAAVLFDVKEDSFRFWEAGRREIPGIAWKLCRYIDRSGPIQDNGPLPDD